MAGSGESVSSNKSLTFSFLYPMLIDRKGSCKEFPPKSAVVEMHRGRPSHFQIKLLAFASSFRTVTKAMSHSFKGHIKCWYNVNW